VRINGTEATMIIETTSQNQNINPSGTVIVTGAAGYIGGSICARLFQKGYSVTGIDKRYLPSHLYQYLDYFIKSDFIDPLSLRRLDRKPLAVIHCAGTSLVGPSIANPQTYYDNNVVKTLKYLDYLRTHSPNTKFIFSSSASVYGDPRSEKPITENFRTNPISPYGESKLMTEIMLNSFNIAHGLKYVSFRYFNACGALADGTHGQEPNATHIFAKIFESVQNKTPFVINGNDYDTKDGTCIRDYVHVADIADAHILAIEKDIEGIYNIGSNTGFSNLEILNAVRRWRKHLTSIQLEYGDRRTGDPAFLVASSEKLQKDTGWKPKQTLQHIIKDLHDWYNSENYAKRSQAIIPL
jgi:UDP-glucose 4-epimerase